MKLLLKRKNKGFTIVELVIVIAVIAVLAAVLIPTFINLTSKANKASDESLVNSLNKALAIEEVDHEVNNMHDAVECLKNEGYITSTLVTKSDQKLLYSLEDNRFLLEEDKKNDIPDYEYWTIQSSYDSANQQYSIYASDTFDLAEVTGLKVGFDAGDSTSVNLIAYDRSSESAAQEVLIRTNKEATTLTVNGYVDSTDNRVGDVIKHFGVAGALSVIKCATGSYHENGQVGFLEINTGRIVLEQKSDVEHIHINKKADEESFDEVVIQDMGTQNLPEAITRDEVSVAAESSVDVVKVIATSGAEEMVKVYGSTATGSTQKTEIQNTGVNSILGGLVLDNGASSDKALSEDAKEEVKDEVASEAVTADFEKEEGDNDYVARIKMTGYATLQAAVEAAVDGNTIALLKDVAFSSNDVLIVNKDIAINLGGKSITGSHDPLFVVGASVGKYNPTSGQLTHTGHLTIRGEGSITSSNWDMFCIFPDATIDVYGGTFTGFKATFYIYGGTLNTYGGDFTATSPSNTYIVQVKGAGTANIYAGNFTTPENGGYGVYLDNASVSNFGSTTGNGPTFNTWRPCIASNGSESHAVLANIYSGTYHSYRSDNATGENSVIQLANNTSETQTLNVYGGTFEQTGSNENRCIFNVRYGGTINVNISGGNFVATSSSRLFNGVGGSTWPSNNNVHVTVQNNAISKTQNVKVYNTSDVYQSDKDFELTIE